MIFYINYSHIENTEDSYQYDLNVLSSSVNLIRYSCLSDCYDYDNDISLQNGMRTIVNNLEEEKVFLSYFFLESEEKEVIVDNGIELNLRIDDNEEIAVFFLNQGDNEYPKWAYGFKYNTDSFAAVATYDASKKGIEMFDEIYSFDEEKFDAKILIKPLQDNQKADYVEEENKIVYSMDSQLYGTYNSSGELFLDENSRPLYKVYYTTNGTRISYYLYDSNGNLSHFYDFGGMAYKGLKNEYDIEIGIDLKVCIFEK